MLSTINMEACQGYQFEEPRFLPQLPQLGVSQAPSEAHENKPKLSWKIHSSRTRVSWCQGLDSSRPSVCSIVKMKGERRVPKLWKKQNTTINQLSIQTNFLLQSQGMNKTPPCVFPSEQQNSHPFTVDAMKRAGCKHQTLLKTQGRPSSSPAHSPARSLQLEASTLGALTGHSTRSTWAEAQG